MGIDWGPVLPVAFAVGGVALIIFMIRWVAARQAAFFKNLEAIGGQGEGLTRTFYSGGKTYTVVYVPPEGKYSPAKLILSLPTQRPFAFYVGKAGWLSLFKEPVWEGKVATGDADFDQKYHVRASDPTLASVYFGEQKRREAALALLNQHWTRLDCDGAVLKAVWEPFPMSPKLDLQFILQSFSPLSDLA